MALQKESRKLHVKMINLSICPTVYCYGHDTDDKMEGKKNKTKHNTLSPKASSRVNTVHLLVTHITKYFPEFIWYNFSFLLSNFYSFFSSTLPPTFSLSLPFSLIPSFLLFLPSFCLFFHPSFISLLFPSWHFILWIHEIKFYLSQTHAIMLFFYRAYGTSVRALRWDLNILLDYNEFQFQQDNNALT